MTIKEEKLSKSKREFENRKPEELKDYIKSIDPVEPWPRKNNDKK